MFSRSIALLSLFLGLSGSAWGLVLNWDLNDPWPERYEVYARTGEIPYDYDVPIWIGSNPPAIFPVDPIGTWYFVARACDGNECSEDSNEVGWVFAEDPDPLATTGWHIVSWEGMDDSPPTGTFINYECVSFVDGRTLCVPR